MRINQDRNYHIDILRCLSMLFVIMQHIFGQGRIMEYAVGTGFTFLFLSFFQIIAHCAVNVYGITTGYLLCTKPFRLSRLGKLWLTTVFWSVAVSCCFFILLPEYRSVRECISMFLPLLRGRYWFFTAYFITVLVSPVLNLLIHSMSRKQFHMLFAALFLVFGIIPVASLGYDVLRISGGNHFAWMFVLYLVGGYLRKYSPTCPQCQSRWIYFFFLFVLANLCWMIAVTLVGFGHYRSLFLTNVSPFVLGQAVCLFQHFSTNIHKILPGSNTAKWLDFIAPGVYSVYVIHVHPLVFWNEDFIAMLRPWDSRNPLLILGGTILASSAVFIVCILLDCIRQFLFHVLKIDHCCQVVCRNAEHLLRKYIR